MAPVLLQVPERGRDFWHRKEEPRTKTNKMHTQWLHKANARPQTLYISASLSTFLENPEMHAISLATLAPMTNRNSAGC